jgi:hypothetical protein
MWKRIKKLKQVIVLNILEFAAGFSITRVFKPGVIQICIRRLFCGSMVSLELVSTFTFPPVVREHYLEVVEYIYLNCTSRENDYSVIPHRTPSQDIF